MAPVVKKNSAAKAAFEKNGSKVMKKKGSKKATEKYPMCPWKMTRYRNALTYHHCDECRDKNYHNEKKAVETSDGGVRLSLYFCKKCSDANIYMGNIYKKTWKEDPAAEETHADVEVFVEVEDEDEE